MIRIIDLRLWLALSLATLAFTTTVQGQIPPAPTATPAIDGIMDAFKTHPLVGLGDDHGMAQEEDFYAALVRDPRFAREVGNVVVEFGNATHQDIIDRFVNGEAVPYTELRKVWTDPIGWAPPPFKLGYVNLFAQIRAVNQALPANQRIHVWLGDPPVDWSKMKTRAEAPKFSSSYRDVFSSQLIAHEILDRKRRALLIFGHFHLDRDSEMQTALDFDTSMAVLIERQNPGVLFVAIPYAGFQDKACNTEFEKVAAAWPAPSLVMPVRDTTLDDAAFRKRCPAFNVASKPSAYQDRYLRMVTGASSEALLYLGPAASLTRSPLLPDAYIDEDYRKEILRHWSLCCMRGEASDMVVEKNTAAPRPFVH